MVRHETGHFRHGAARNWAFPKLGISESHRVTQNWVFPKLGITGNWVFQTNVDTKLGISDGCGHKTGYFRRLWTQNWVLQQTGYCSKLGISDVCGHKTGYFRKLGIAANWVFQTSVENWVFQETGNFMRRFPVGEQRVGVYACST